MLGLLSAVIFRYYSKLLNDNVSLGITGSNSNDLSNAMHVVDCIKLCINMYTSLNHVSITFVKTCF